MLVMRRGAQGKLVEGTPSKGSGPKESPMPYRIVQRGSKFQVVGETGKVHGTHPTKEKAQAQMRALYANVKDAGGGGKPRKIVWRKKSAPKMPMGGGGRTSGMGML